MALSATSAMIFVLVFPLAVMCNAQTWNGHFETVDGVKLVINPATPIQPREIFEAKELWRVSDDREDHVLGRIGGIVVGDDGKTYILDTQLKEVVVYNATGEFLGTVGREGDGPGEFRYPGDVMVTPDHRVGVVQYVPGRIHMFAPNGDPMPDYPLPEPDENGRNYLRAATWTPGGVVVHQYQRPLTDDGGLVSIESLVAIDEDGLEFARYCDHKSVRRAPDNKRIEGDYGLFPADWAVGSEGHVVVRTKYDEYELTVYDSRGDVDRIVTRQYESRRRLPDARDALQNYYDETYEGRRWRGNIGPIEYVVHEYDADIQEFFLRDDRSLWVLTSRGAYGVPRGEMGTFDVFDNEGRFIRQVTLQGKGDYWTDDYFVSGDKLFVVTNVGPDIPGWCRDDGVSGDRDEGRSVICYQLPR